MKMESDKARLLNLAKITELIHQMKGSPHNVVAIVLNYDIIEGKFDLMSRYYVNFETNILGNPQQSIK